MAACLRQVDDETKDLRHFKELITNAFNVLRQNATQVRSAPSFLCPNFSFLIPLSSFLFPIRLVEL